jgi:hypothetical protein
VPILKREADCLPSRLFELSSPWWATYVFDFLEPARSRGKAAFVREVAPELPEAVFERPKTGFYIPVMQWLEPGRNGGRSLGDQSRRLALKVLEEMGIASAD